MTEESWCEKSKRVWIEDSFILMRLILRRKQTSIHGLLLIFCQFFGRSKNACEYYTSFRRRKGREKNDFGRREDEWKQCQERTKDQCSFSCFLSFVEKESLDKVVDMLLCLWYLFSQPLSFFCIIIPFLNFIPLSCCYFLLSSELSLVTFLPRTATTIVNIIFILRDGPFDLSHHPSSSEMFLFSFLLPLYQTLSQGNESRRTSWETAVVIHKKLRWKKIRNREKNKERHQTKNSKEGLEKQPFLHSFSSRFSLEIQERQRK